MKAKTKQVSIPPSIAEQAMIRLMRVGDRLWRESDERFSRWGLTDNHYNVLRILNGAGEPLAQVEIGRRMLSSRANVTKLVDLLEARGLVARRPCGDRRVNHVVLTDAGLRFLADTVDEIQGIATATMSKLSRADQKTLFRLLGRLLDD
jgi:MarR family 2-MHQ and catechol resistance regulon transcriptional repressor